MSRRARTIRFSRATRVAKTMTAAAHDLVAATDFFNVDMTLRALTSVRMEPCFRETVLCRVAEISSQTPIPVSDCSLLSAKSTTKNRHHVVLRHVRAAMRTVWDSQRSSGLLRFYPCLQARLASRMGAFGETKCLMRWHVFQANLAGHGSIEGFFCCFRDGFLH